MESYPRVGANGNVDMVPLQQQVQVQTVGGGTALVLTPTMDNNLPQPLYMLGLGQVMTDEQLETLRRQISVYSTICHQLVEMHKASVSAQSTLAGMVGVRHINYDPLMGTPNHKTTARQRWTPSQNQLQILERLFDQGNGTPNKTRIREITADLSQHGQIAETNVYNWFQNRKARAKRKQQMVPTRDGESEVDTDNDSPKEKKPKFDKDSGQEYSNSGGLGETGGHSSDGGGTYEQKPGVIDQYEQESASSGAQMQSQADSKQSGHTFGRSMSFDQAYGKGVSNNTSMTNNSPLSNNPPMSNMLVDPGKLVDMPRAVGMDVKSGFDENAILVDSCGQNVRTEDAGTSLQPLHARESYRLTTGRGDGVGRTTSGASESMHAHSMQQGVGILNNGLKNGSMVRSQAQG